MEDIIIGLIIKWSDGATDNVADGVHYKQVAKEIVEYFAAKEKENLQDILLICQLNNNDEITKQLIQEQFIIIPRNE